VSKDILLPVAGLSESLDLPLSLTNVFQPLVLSESLIIDLRLWLLPEILTNDFPLVHLSEGLTIHFLPESLDLPLPLLSESLFWLLRLSERRPLDFSLPLLESMTRNPPLSLLSESLPPDFHLPLLLGSLTNNLPPPLLSESLALDIYLPLLSEKSINLWLALPEYSMVTLLV
jgi:hypothetical protein